MNKILRTIIMFLSFCEMIACGSGFVTSQPGPTQTYTYTNFVGPNVVQTNCNVTSAPFYTCNKNSSSFSYAVAFSSVNTSGYATSGTIAYLQLPSPLPAGVTMNTTPGCANQTGLNYSCKITLDTTNVVSGTVINVPYNGTLGYQGGFTITYQ